MRACVRVLGARAHGRVYARAQVALLIHSVLPFVMSLASPDFSTLTNKWYDFPKKKVIKRKICVLVFSTILFKTFLILGRTFGILS